MKTIRVFSALSLVMLAPCVLSGQNAAAPAPEPAPVARRVETRVVRTGTEVVRPARMAMAGMRQPMMMDAASMFLLHTGDMQLTDAQVTRLAAIARRSEARHKAMRARTDSMVVMRGQSEQAEDGGGARFAVMMRVPAPTDAELKAQHEDDREAFAVPSADQLATVWEIMMARHHGR